MEFQRDVSLKNHTTFKIGGRAKYFFTARTKKDLIKAVKAAKKLKLPFFVLGGGSNLLVSDEEFKGLVVKIQNTKYKILNTKIMAEVGVTLGQLVRASGKAGLTGLEWASGIPGTVGGAVFGNAGAFQKSMKDVVETVETFNLNNKKIKILKNRDCKFGYKKSIFKKDKNLVILSCTLQLKRGNKKEIKEKVKYFLDYREKNHPLDFCSAGSVFKNCKLRVMNQKLFNKLPKLKQFQEKGIIPAGYLIEKCGLKGKRIGQAKISEKHANFIVNLGNARAKDVKKLINLIKKEVKKKFKINLEEEIQFL